MQMHPPCGSTPRQLDARASASLEGLRFGVFRRMRSLGGADVFPRGLPTRGARPIEQVSLAEALTRRWDDDRHVVLYTSDRPYRINNGAVSKVGVAMQLVALDVDNHDDDAPGWLDGERPKIAALLAAHPGGFVHTTKRGWRALYALPHPFPIRSEADKEAFALLYARLASYVFEHFGIVTDDAMTRWNQPIRLPHVVRDGRVFDAEVISGSAHAIGVLELPADMPSVPDLRALSRELPRWRSVAKRWEPKRDLFRVVASAAFDHIPLPPYPDRVAAAATWAREHAPRAVMGHGGRATARSVAATLHVGFALEREDIERILTGSYNRRRCSPPWAAEEIGDLQTIAHAVARSPINVWGFMVTRDRTGVEAARATLAAAAASRHVVALEDVPARIRGAIQQYRAVVVRGSCGVGKTYELIHYIVTESRCRVLVVVPTHKLARMWVEALAAAGETDVAYHASVVQRRDDAGVRYCDNRIALKLYARGGDVARDVCPSCPRASTCPAYAMRPNPRARVHVLPREMLVKMDVTEADLVVFDDAATDLLAWHRLGVRQLRRLSGADARMLPDAQRRYLFAFVEALLAGSRHAEEHAHAVLDEPGAAVPEGEALRWLARRVLDGARSPRVANDVLAEGGDELAATLRDVGTLRDVLRFASACADGAAVHWSRDTRSVHGESAAAKLLRTHEGRLVVLDATASLEELRALRSDLHVERIDVDDAGETTRTLLFATHATRTALRDPGERRARLDLWLPRVLEHVTQHRARRLVLVAYKSIVRDLEAHPALVAWLAEDPRRTLRVAHYGALRGLNRFARADAVVTLGDPWLNGDDVLGRAEWLGLDEPSYRVGLATAELGQAHGRSRSVRRRRRLTHVHVGRLVPDGWGQGVTVDPLDGPPERTLDAAERIEFAALVGRLGGNRAAATVLGCSPSAVAGWRAGTRGLPRAVLDQARHVATLRTHPTASSEEAPGGWGGLSVMDAPPCKSSTRGCVHHDAEIVVPLGQPEMSRELEGERMSDEAVLASSGGASSPSLPFADLTPPASTFPAAHDRDSLRPLAGGEKALFERRPIGLSLPAWDGRAGGAATGRPACVEDPRDLDALRPPALRSAPAVGARPGGAAPVCPTTAAEVGRSSTVSRPPEDGSRRGVVRGVVRVLSLGEPATQAAFAARVLAVLEEIEPSILAHQKLARRDTS